MDVSVIVPTYREADNLPLLVPRLAAALKQAGLRGEIIVVDDNSPDATVPICAELADQYPLCLEVRVHERGLSSAVVHGMRRATGKILVVMDADLSHPPEKVPDLVAAIEAGADFAIGSRYVAGGRTAEDWGLLRWLNSKAATLLAWPLTRARDPMAGFFALRRETFERARNLDPIGYKIGLEFLVKCGCKNVREVPISFANRVHGESKLTLKEQLNYLRHLKRLYDFQLGRAAQPLKFGLVGLLGVAVQLLALTLFVSFLSRDTALALAIWLAMTSNFFLNRAVTFAGARSGSMGVQYVLFVASCLAGASVNWAVTVWLASISPFFTDYFQLAAVIGVVAAAVFNYVLCVTAAFRVKKPKSMAIIGVSAEERPIESLPTDCVLSRQELS